MSDRSVHHDTYIGIEMFFLNAQHGTLSLVASERGGGVVRLGVGESDESLSSGPYSISRGCMHA